LGVRKLPQALPVAIVERETGAVAAIDDARGNRGRLFSHHELREHPLAVLFLTAHPRRKLEILLVPARLELQREALKGGKLIDNSAHISRLALAGIASHPGTRKSSTAAHQRATRNTHAKKYRHASRPKAAELCHEGSPKTSSPPSKHRRCARGHGRATAD